MEMTNKPINTAGCKGKSVRCIETGVTYKSASEAAREIGCHNSMISHVCRGDRNRTAKGKHFCYVSETPATETIPDSAKEIIVSKPSIVKGKGSRTNGNTNPVLCITDGSIYTSCTDAAEQNGIFKGNMSHVCNHKGTSIKGKQYCYIKDIDQHLDAISDAISKKNAYQVLLAKENRRRQLRNMIADYKGDIARLESELSETYAKLSKAEQELINMD